MRRAVVMFLAAGACGHATGQGASAVTNTRQPAAGIASLTFHGTCMPSVLRLPVYVDLQPRRTPNIDKVVLLKPLCIANRDEPTWCFEQPAAIVDQSKPPLHGKGIATLSVIYAAGDPPRLSVSVEAFEPTKPVMDTFTEASSVVEDGCVAIPWASDEVGTARYVRGEVSRVDANGPWIFRPWPPICAPSHRPGDDRIIAPFPIGGAGIPATGIAVARLTGTLRPSPNGFTGATDAVVAEPEWHIR